MKKYIGALWLEYDRAFGCKAKDIRLNKYWDEEEPEYPPVSVSVYKKEDTGRPHDIIVTSGMSFTPMHFDDSYKGDRWSSELIIYVDDVSDEDISWIFWLAILPFIDNFALGYAHTISNPDPLYKGSSLCNFLFMNSLIKSDAEALSGFNDFPYPIDLLWVVPITSAEYEYKKQNGFNEMLDLFQKYDHPITLNRHRSSYIQNA